MTKRVWLSLIPLSAFALLLAALAVGLSSNRQAASKFADHLNERAPPTDWPVTGDSLAHFKTANWQGRAYIVNFFASWCVPCHAEHPYLLDLSRDNIPIIGVAFQDSADAAGGFLAKDGNPFALIIDDPQGRAGIDWGVTGVPETFLIDRAGVIRFHLAGPLTKDVVERQLVPLWREVNK